MRPADYEILYDLPAGEYDQTAVGGIRTRTTRAGDTLEVECFPITRLTAGTRQALRQKKSSPAQAKLNRRNRARRIARLTDENFTRQDWVLTGTYEYPARDIGMMSPAEAAAVMDANRCPWDMDRARRDVVNFIQRVRRAVKRAGGDPKEVKHLYVIEEGKAKLPGLPPRYHFHMVLHAPGLTRDQLSALWPFGFTRLDRLDLEHGGADRLSKYLTKQQSGGRCWGHSRNLREPRVTTSDRKVSRRRAALVARDVLRNGRQVMEALYPGYRCDELPVVTFSDLLPGAYIYARLRRRAPAPPQLRGGSAK